MQPTDPVQRPEPVTWCRILAVGPPCHRPCGECKRANADLDPDVRAEILAGLP